MSILKNFDIHTPDPRHLSHGRQIPTEFLQPSQKVVVHAGVTARRISGGWCIERKSEEMATKGTADTKEREAEDILVLCDRVRQIAFGLIPWR